MMNFLLDWHMNDALVQASRPNGARIGRSECVTGHSELW